jgi:hypothetical protein
MESRVAPGRSCGECNACCRYYSLMADFNKPQGVLCQNWKAGTGCSIHETRPSICRNYYCHWLQNPRFDDSWRPDRSGIIIRDTREDIPPDWPQRQGLVFELYGPDASIEALAFLETVALQVINGVPVFLSAHGPLGFGNMTAFLNVALGPAVATRDAAHVLAALRDVLRQMRDTAPLET